MKYVLLLFLVPFLVLYSADERVRVDGLLAKKAIPEKLKLLDKYNYVYSELSNDDPRAEIFSIADEHIKILSYQYRKILAGICMSHAFAFEDNDGLYYGREAVECYIRLMNIDSRFAENGRVEILNVILKNAEGVAENKIVKKGGEYRIVSIVK